VSYTSTGVVLTVVATTPSNSGNTPAPALAVAATKSALSKPVAVASTLRHPIAVGGGVRKPILVAGVTSHATEVSNLRSWEHVPVAPSWERLQGVSVTRSPLAANLGAMRSDLAQRIDRGSVQGTIPVRAPLAVLSGVSNSHRVPVRTFTPLLPKVR
jgi:hypothetical protein